MMNITPCNSFEIVFNFIIKSREKSRYWINDKIYKKLSFFNFTIENGEKSRYWIDDKI